MARRQLRVEDYTVGWICALPVELAASVEMLEEEHGSLPGPIDHNSYIFGRIAKHDVVMACLPGGQMGISSATLVATQMRLKFKSIRFCLLVGIGGGVPSANADVRLGDVVVSQPYLNFPGVVQYDFGKTGPAGQNERIGSLNAPPALLLTALSVLRANVLRGKAETCNYLRRLSHLPQFTYQGAENDILFKTTYNHVKGPTCELCNKNELLTRETRKVSDPVLHFGTIGSGNQVIKDGATRDRISAEIGGILCYEMEAAGLMNVFPSLVIRGICDYADSHKNKRWQQYAAATAAACAKELLHLVQGQEESKLLS
jgi:nucleoside phosphorylase